MHTIHGVGDEGHETGMTGKIGRRMELKGRLIRHRRLILGS
jgi:hypothetical protein